MISLDEVIGKIINRNIMLSPEVWTFPPPKSNYKERTGNFITEGTPEEITSFHYSHSVIIKQHAALNTINRLIIISVGVYSPTRYGRSSETYC